MTTHKGFAGIAVLIVLGLIVVGGAGYVALNPHVLTPDKSNGEAVREQDRAQGVEAKVLSGADIHWKLDDAGERDHIPYTKVSVQVGEEVHEVGDFQGSCSILSDTNAGIDGKGLVAGELSAVQCYFAGGGDEIGVFAHEDGGYQIMVGALEEPIEGGAGFRGDFKIKFDVP